MDKMRMKMNGKMDGKMMVTWNEMMMNWVDGWKIGWMIWMRKWWMKNGYGGWEMDGWKMDMVDGIWCGEKWSYQPSIMPSHYWINMTDLANPPVVDEFLSSSFPYISWYLPLRISGQELILMVLSVPIHKYHYCIKNPIISNHTLLDKQSYFTG